MKEKKVAELSAPKSKINIVEIRSDDETLAAIGDNHFMLTNNPLINNIYDYNVPIW